MESSAVPQNLPSREPTGNPYQARSVSGITRDELRVVYDDWAPTYLEYVRKNQKKSGVIAARRLVEAMCAADMKSASVLDAGCGGGEPAAELVTAAKAADRVLSITGTDFSEGMLEISRDIDVWGGRVFDRLVQADLSKVLPFDDGEFDAWICVGVLLDKHCGPEIFAPIARTIRKGGIGVATVRTITFEDNEVAYMEAINDAGFEIVSNCVDDYNKQSKAHYFLLRKL